MKRIRLDKEVYFQCGRPCHVTICSKNEIPVFAAPELTLKCMDLLESLCEKYKFELLVYCFMPDHLHFIASVQGNKSTMYLVQAFKSLVTKESYNYGFEGKIFQPRFYDHFPRKWESLEKHIRYILENPVRRGLVKDYRDYPYSRCFFDV